MDEKTRRVEIIAPSPVKTGYHNGYGWTYTSRMSPPITYVQTTRSRGHAWPKAKGASVTDVGGDFSTARVTSLTSNFTGVSTGQGGSNLYEGREWAVSPLTAANAALNGAGFSSDLKLGQLGTTAIANCLPTNPTADAATFIGELKSGLPSLPAKALFKSKFKDHREYGSEYLNIEFGWKPLVSDLQKFGKAAMESDKILEQLRRDSGKPVRRKYTFPDEITTSTTVSPYGYAGLSIGMPTNVYYSELGGQLTQVTETKVRTWFSGCFTYHLNLGDTLPDRLSRQAAEARKLFGVELTPATVWNLAPWSWIVDWEGNIGDVLHNVSRFAQDGLVMRYGYIMQEKTCKVDYTLTWPGRLNTSPRQSLELSCTATSKIRRRATPFGFGFDMTALTGRQSAILGALGISRSPKRL